MEKEKSAPPLRDVVDNYSSKYVIILIIAIPTNKQGYILR